MDLWSPEEHTSCCSACASLGEPASERGATTFRYHAQDKLAIRVHGRTSAEDFPVAKAVIVVGRTAGRADVVLRDPNISRVQCRFVFAHGMAQVEDMGSTCGTIVNGRMVQRTTLREGDIIRVGDSRLEVVRV